MAEINQFSSMSQRNIKRTRDFLLNCGDTPLPTRSRAVGGVAWCS